MRTGIYVYKPTTVVIHAAESGLKLARFGGKADHATLSAANKIDLAPGIYRVLSSQPITVTGADLEVVTRGDDKDKWPEPPPKASMTFSSDSTDVSDFFATKSIQEP